MPYYTSWGQEIEDMEMDTMLYEARHAARIEARIEAMARSVGFMCEIEDLPEDVYAAFYDEAEQAIEELEQAEARPKNFVSLFEDAS